MSAQAQEKSCLFCRIVAGEIPSTRVFEDADCIVINDIQPKAKIHWLVIPRKHLVSLEQAYPAQGADYAGLIGNLMGVGTRLARQKGLLPGGFRAVINTGPDGGQSVFHLHVHVLGSSRLSGEFA